MTEVSVSSVANDISLFNKAADNIINNSLSLAHGNKDSYNRLCCLLQLSLTPASKSAS